ncbi:MAG: thiamine phosphate synthase [Bdellovibrionales bacterium]|nr:thiamine phosphate synthase [Bdellovibrionales bacterium]
MTLIARFQFLTHDSPKMTHAQQAEMVCSAGGRWIQLRTKGKDYNEWRRVACEVQEVCRSFGATFILNDNVRIAKEIGADGVHLGKLDMSIPEARRMLGDEFLVGGTANTADDLLQLDRFGVDYIGLG